MELKEIWKNIILAIRTGELLKSELIADSCIFVLEEESEYHDSVHGKPPYCINDDIVKPINLETFKEEFGVTLRRAFPGIDKETYEFDQRSSERSEKELKERFKCVEPGVNEALKTLIRFAKGEQGEDEVLPKEGFLGVAGTIVLFGPSAYRRFMIKRMWYLGVGKEEIKYADCRLPETYPEVIIVNNNELPVHLSIDIFKHPSFEYQVYEKKSSTEIREAEITRLSNEISTDFLQKHRGVKPKK